MPKTILQEHIYQDRSTLACSCKPIKSFKAETSFSVIGQHLLQNPTCTHEYNDNKFSILARGHTSFHFPLLKPRTSKHPNQIYANKKNSLWSKNYTLVSTPSIGCFFYQSRCSFFPFFSFLSIVSLFTDSLYLFTLFLMDSLEKCQTKSFENEYSTFCDFQILYH